MRLIPAEMPRLDWAGFPSEIATRLSQVRNGLVLISGVAGSGKSTIARALCQRFASRRILYLVSRRSLADGANEDCRAFS